MCQLLDLSYVGQRYLSDEEFEEVFGMTPADFAILSSWCARTSRIVALI